MRGAVVDDPEHPVSAGVGLGGHHLLDQSPERLDTGCGFHPADHAGVVHVVGAQIGQRPLPFVLVLDSHHPGFASRQRGVAATAGLDRGFLIRAEDKVIAGQRFTVDRQ